MSARQRKESGKKEDRPRRPWRESIEGITVAIVMAVFLKYFIVEAYKIPSGSMQPTLMGSPATGIFDRILVDKLSYHMRDPERFEVVVFKHPLQRSLNMIKRIVGLGGESLKIEHGDLWTRREGDTDWRILRRPDPVQHEMWRSLRTSGVWRPGPDTTGWRTGGDAIAARGNGRALFPGVVGSVRNGYVDGYPEKVATVIRRRPEKTGKYAVGDLRVEGEITALEGLTAVRLEFFEGARRYVFELPGPGAATDHPSVRVDDPQNPEAPSATAADPFRLEPGDAVDFAAQNLDDRLQLEVDGDVVLELDIARASNQQSRIELVVEGAGADIAELEVFRDIYYVSEGMRQSRWDIPVGHYVMLGDNTLDSADTRDWAASEITVQTDEGVLELVGNSRRGENPWVDPSNPTHFFFRDQWGERWTFDPENVTERTGGGALVPRLLVTGRALAVFWPVSWKYRVARLRWIH